MRFLIVLEGATARDFKHLTIDRRKEIFLGTRNKNQDFSVYRKVTMNKK
jgi:hypothetical protein